MSDQPDSLDPVAWNLERAMEHLVAIHTLIEQGKEVPRAFQVELEAVIIDLAGVQGLAQDLGVSES